MSGVNSANGYLMLYNTTFTQRYYIKDHLGNNRMVVNRAGAVYQNNNCYPYGGMTALGSGQGYQQFKYNGKEYDPMHGLDEYDYGARQYDPAIGRFTTIDPLCEKYYHISPYTYCAGNPVMFVDPDGDSIRINEKYRSFFMSSLRDIFGEYSNDFSFTDTRMLNYHGNAKDLSRNQKKILKGLEKIISDKKITNILYDKEANIEGKYLSSDKLHSEGGAVTQLSSENGTIHNYIIIDQNAPTSIKSYVLTKHFYNYFNRRSEALEKGIALFSYQSFDTNTTDRTFHELGHVLYDSQNQSKVIDYNNSARKILGLPIRMYDESHNPIER